MKYYFLALVFFFSNVCIAWVRGAKPKAAGVFEVVSIKPGEVNCDEITWQAPNDHEAFKARVQECEVELKKKSTDQKTVNVYKALVPFTMCSLKPGDKADLVLVEVFQSDLIQMITCRKEGDQILTIEPGLEVAALKSTQVFAENNLRGLTDNSYDQEQKQKVETAGDAYKLALKTLDIDECWAAPEGQERADCFINSKPVIEKAVLSSKEPKMCLKLLESTFPDKTFSSCVEGKHICANKKGDLAKACFKSFVRKGVNYQLIWEAINASPIQLEEKDKLLESIALFTSENGLNNATRLCQKITNPERNKKCNLNVSQNHKPKKIAVEVGKKTWMDNSYRKLYFNYPQCWDLNQEPSKIGQSRARAITLTATSRCSKLDQGDWNIVIFGPGNDDIYPKSSLKKVGVNFRDKYVNFYDVSDNSHDAASIRWRANFKCNGGLPLNIRYNKPVSSVEFENAVKQHQVPEVFKDFLRGFNCICGEDSCDEMYTAQ